MNFKEHTIGGIIISIIMFFVGLKAFSLSYFDSFFASCLCFIASLWPDIDTKSHSQGLLYALFFGFDIYLLVMNKFAESAFFGLFCMLPMFLKHRGITHRVSVALIAPIFLFYWNTWFYFYFVVGYLTHLYLDR